MRIGEVAERAGVTTKTVRYYEEIGLLPLAERTSSGYRSYDSATVERLRFIRDAQTAGLSLGDIASILELKEQGRRSCEHTRALLRRQIDEIDLQIERLQHARNDLVELVDRADQADPAACIDEHRCQVIEARLAAHHAPRRPAGRVTP